MRKYHGLLRFSLTLLVLCLPFALSWAASRDAGTSRQPSDELSRQRSTPTVSPNSNELSRPVAPTTIYTTSRRNPSQGRFLRTHRRELGLGRFDRLKKDKSTKSVAGGLTYHRYQQYYRDVPVEGATFVLIERNGGISSGTGRIVSGLSVDVEPQLDTNAARELVKGLLAKEVSRDLSTLTFHTEECDLMVLSPDGTFTTQSYRLGYRCTVASRSPSMGLVLDIDANSGELLMKTTTILEAWVSDVGSGNTVYDGLASGVDVERNDVDGSHRLRSSTVVTKSLLNSGVTAGMGDAEVIGHGVDYLSSSSYFSGVSNIRGMSVHWSTQRAIDFIQKQFDIDVVNGAGNTRLLGTFDSYVETPSAWHDWKAWFDPNPDPPVKPSAFYSYDGSHYVTMDIVGHEVGHLLGYQLGGGKTYNHEPGAIMESFSDIIGQMTEHHTFGQSDWISAQQIPVVPEFRKLRNFMFPHQSNEPQPDVYQGTYWIDANDPYDKAGVHVNDSLQNKWFYMLARGQSGTNSLGNAYLVRPVGVDVASYILFDGYFQLGADAVYMDAAGLYTLIAGEMCGAFSQERVSSYDGWWAVDLNPAPFSELQHISPPQGDSSVKAGQVALKWQVQGAGPPESEWEVQLSLDENFKADVQSQITSQTENDNGVEVGVAQFDVFPGMKYYWRVRRANDDSKLADACWRTPNGFTTVEQKITNLYPHSRSTEHPWELEFSWDKAEKAVAYDLEVARDAAFDKVIVRKQDIAENKIVLDVLKDTELFWRVRPKYQWETKIVAGSWSETSFNTELDQTSILSPNQGSSAGPWPVLLEWDPVTGADHYLLYLSVQCDRTRSDEVLCGETKSAKHAIGLAGFLDANGPAEKNLTPADFPLLIPSSKTTYAVDVNADDSQLVYAWGVEPYGPLIGDPEHGLDYIQEHGDKKTSNFRPDINATISERYSPSLPLGRDACPEPSAKHYFKPVQSATDYHLLLEPQFCVPKPPPAQGEPPQPYCEIGERAKYGSWTTASCNDALGYECVLGPDKQQVPPGAGGFRWFIQAEHDGLLGFTLPVDQYSYFLKPEKPTLIGPPDEHFAMHGEPVMLSWKSDVAQYYEVEAVYNPQAPSEFTTILPAASSAPGQSGGPIIAKCTSFIGCAFDWRVRAAVMPMATGCQPSDWTKYRTVQVLTEYLVSDDPPPEEDEEIEPAPPVSPINNSIPAPTWYEEKLGESLSGTISVQNNPSWVTSILLFQWKKVAGANSYVFEAYQDSPPGSTTKYMLFNLTNQQLAGMKSIYTGGPIALDDPNYWGTYLQPFILKLGASETNYYFRVQACDGSDCGMWSKTLHYQYVP